jgi:hypothetical protein
MRGERSPTQLNLFVAIDPRFMRGASPSPGVDTTPSPLVSPPLGMLRDFARSSAAVAGAEPVTSSPRRNSLPPLRPVSFGLGSTSQGEDR